jgi:Protein of unknown function (DUF3592)
LAQADLITPRVTRRIPASAFAGLFGVFAGCCATFAAIVTISDWSYTAPEARWPQLAAVVDRAEVIVSASGGKEGDRTVTTLRYQVHYQAGGREQTATLTSRGAFSDTEATRLQTWAMQHRKGGTIDIRYNPSAEGRAVFSSLEVSDAGSRVTTDVWLLIVSALASAGLLALTKYLRRREAFAEAANSSGRKIATPG